ncbi:hypothetical protein J4G37_60560, partial [Microvirga sp. 3-52]|nr:hypothetical protein [Microvirga sp. 3-52]
MFVVLLVGFFVMLPISSPAEEPSSPSGKLRFQTERIGKDGKSKSQVDKMTELEKSLPHLFSEET